MSIVICPECQSKISDTAKKCVHCGYNMEFYTSILSPKTSEFIKRIIDLYFAVMIIGFANSWSFTTSAFINFKFELFSINIYPWLIIPLIFSGLLRGTMMGILYTGFILMLVAFLAGPEFIKFY